MAYNINKLEGTTSFIRMAGKNGDIFVKEDALKYYDFKNELNILSPISGQISTASSSQIEFDLSSTGVHRVEDIFFTVNVTASGAAAVPMPLFFQILRVELLVNGTSAVTIASQNFYYDIIMSDSEYIAQQAQACGFTYNPSTYAITADTVGVTTTAVRTYSMPIVSMLRQLWLPTLKTNNVKIRVTFDSGTNLVASGLYTDLVYSAPQIYLQGKVYKPSTFLKLNSQYKLGPHVSRCRIQRNTSMSVGVLTGGVQYQQVIGSLTGSMSKLCAQVWEVGSSPAATDKLAFFSLSSLSLIDDNGKPWSFYSVPTALLKQQIMLSKYNTPVCIANNLYMMPFAKNPREVQDLNIDSGSIYFTGKYAIYFTPTASSTRACTLQITADEIGIVVQNGDGSIEVVQIKSDEDFM